MSAKDVFCLKETTWGVDFAFHHFSRIGEIIHVMRFTSMRIVENQSGTFFSSGTSNALEEIAGLGRNIGISHHIQVTDVNTHFKSGCSRQHIHGIGMWVLLEISFKLFSVISLQQPCVFSGIYTGRYAAVIYLLVVIEFRNDFF